MSYRYDPKDQYVLSRLTSADIGDLVLLADGSKMHLKEKKEREVLSRLMLLGVACRRMNVDGVLERCQRMIFLARELSLLG
jgi:hypothetical protein